MYNVVHRAAGQTSDLRDSFRKEPAFNFAPLADFEFPPHGSSSIVSGDKQQVNQLPPNSMQVQQAQ